MAVYDKFIFMRDWLDIVECYNENQQLILLKSIIEIGLNPDLKLDSYPNEIKPPLILIKESMARMRKEYEKKSIAGKKGMQSRWGNRDLTFYTNKWNEMNLTNVDLTEERKTSIQNFLKTYKKEDFEKMIEMIQCSQFLKGKNKRNWKIPFDFAIQTENAQKILDGNYNDGNNINIKEIWN